MALLPEVARDLLKVGHVVWVATVGQDGWPNVAIKGSGGLIDDETLYFCDLFSKKTRANLLNDTRVALGIYNAGLKVAIQVKGHATLVESGEFFEQISTAIASRNAGLPAVRYIVKVKVESVWDMGSGSGAGERIA